MRSRVLGVAAAGALAMGATAVLPMNAARAATTYTWVAGWDGGGNAVPGADHHDWDNGKNWSPQGVPGAADAVVLTNAPAYNGVQSSTELNVPVSGVTVASLTIRQPGAGSVRLLDGPVTVATAFEWTGGEVHSPVTLATSSVGRIGSGQLKPLHARMTVRGKLTLDDIGADENTKLQPYPDDSGDNDGITVTSTGTLAANGTNLVGGSGCCTDPARIVNQGTLDIASGQTTFSAVEVDQLGTVRLAPAARLTQTTGPARLGAGASYRGGGTMEFVDTASIAYAPNTSPVPGGVLMQGIGTLADNTRLLFDKGAKVTGVGGFTGSGLLDFDVAPNPAEQSATVYGDLSTGPATRVRFAGAYPARLSVWNPGLSGYHGVLRIAGAAALAAGKSFVPASGTTTVVDKGGSLSLQPGSTWGGGDCCTGPAKLSISAGATLAIPSGSGSAAKVNRVDLRSSGTINLGSGRALSTAGYPITLGGTLKVAGTTAATASRTVITAETIKGRFACVSPGSQVATYSPTAVRLVGTLGSFSGCRSSLDKVVIAKTVRKKQTLQLTVRGVPAAAKKVLLAVTITKPAKKAKLKVGGVLVKAAAKKTTTRYVVARRARGKVTIASAGATPVKIKVVLVGVPR